MGAPEKLKKLLKKHKVKTWMELPISVRQSGEGQEVAEAILLEVNKYIGGTHGILIHSRTDHDNWTGSEDLGFEGYLQHYETVQEKLVHVLSESTLASLAAAKAVMQKNKTPSSADGGDTEVTELVLEAVADSVIEAAKKLPKDIGEKLIVDVAKNVDKYKKQFAAAGFEAGIGVKKKGKTTKLKGDDEDDILEDLMS